MAGPSDPIFVPPAVQPRYEVLPTRLPHSGLEQPEPTTFNDMLNAATRQHNWRLIAQRMWSMSNQPEPGYNPAADVEGYEEYADELFTSRSRDEMAARKATIDQTVEDKDTLARGDWGLAAEFVAGLVDPVNYIPIPITKGIGIVKGLAVGASANVGITAISDAARLQADPTMEPGEMLYSMALAGLIGGTFGAAAGAWGYRARAAFRDFEKSLSEVDNLNEALVLRGSDDGIRIDLGVMPDKDPMTGIRPLISMTEELGTVPMKAVAGENFSWDEGLNRWIYAADRGLPSPRGLLPDIVNELGTPVRSLETVMKVDEGRLKHIFARGGWEDEVRALLPAGIRLETVIRHGDDLVNFHSRWALWKRTLPRVAGETAEAHAARAGVEAMKEFRASRGGGKPAKALGSERLAWFMQRLNFSPVAKAGRVFAGDNRLNTAILQLGGDYGTALNFNELGIRSPPPLMLKAMQHTKAYADWRTVFDREYLRYASKQKDAIGRTALNYNLSAAAEAVKARANRFVGDPNAPMTIHEFGDMVGQAVYLKDDFDVNGHRVNEHARAAAKDLTRLMQNYEKMFSEAGMFAEQKSLERLIRGLERDLVNAKNGEAQWLWGLTRMPSALIPAIRVGKRIFVGINHENAVNRMRDALGTRADAALDAMTRADFGYVPRQRRGRGMQPSQAAPAMQPAVVPEGQNFILLRDLPGLLVVNRDELPAVKWGDDIITGLDHHQAVMNAIERYGDEFESDFELNPEDYLGYKRVKRKNPEQDQRNLEYAERPWREREAELLAMTNEQLQARYDELAYGETRIHPWTLLTHKEIYDLSFADFHEGSEQLGLERMSVLLEQKRREKEALEGPEELEHPEEFEDYDSAAEYGEWTERAPQREHTPRQKRRGPVEMPTDPRPGDQLSDPEYNMFETTGEALDYAIRTSDDPDLRGIARHIREMVQDVPFRVVETDEYVGQAMDDAFRSKGWLGAYDGNFDDIHIRGASWNERLSGGNPQTVVHEAMHAATYRRIALGLEDIKDGAIDTPHAKVAQEIIEFQEFLKKQNEFSETTQLTDEQMATVNWQVQIMMDDPQEVLTYGLTSPTFRAYLAETPYTQAQTMLERFWELVRKLLGLPKKYQNGLERLGEVANDVFDTTDPVMSPTYELSVPQAARGAPQNKFKSIDDTISDRVNSLSAKQRRIYEERSGHRKMIEDHISESQLLLKDVTDNPHTFLDANGDPEPYFGRYWNNPKIGDEREKVEYLVEKWFERTHPNDAGERAKETVDNILTNDAGSAHQKLGSTRALGRRALDIPNSWSVTHPEWGLIRVADYIDNNAVRTTETYIRRGAARLEAARMFGDADLRQEKARNREYMLKRYYDPAETDEERFAAMQKINEYERYYDLTARTVLGTLRVSDPWRFDNRLGRGLMHATSLSVLGKVLITTLPEMMRPAMITGMGNAFRSVFSRYFSDLESVRGTREIHAATGDLFDVIALRANARMAENQQGEVATGGTWWENWLADRMPGYFKLVGLSEETVIMKDMMMTASGHMVMQEAKRVAAAIKSGQAVSQQDLLRLGAMGISKRDALILDSMPVEMRGKLIQPAIHLWTGGNARQAREIFMRAIAAEARRGISTPSVADRSTLFEGVWTRKGHVVFESDLLRVPMQFLSYGVGAQNKVAFSAMQGRDRSVVAGVLMMMLMGGMVTYLKTPEWAYKKKGYDDLLLEAWENSGIGGFWFGDLNQQIERFTMNKIGIRPTLGMDPKFGKGSELDGVIDTMGAAPGHYFDISRMFWDPDLTASQRAQLGRRLVLYNNVLWWHDAARRMAGAIGGAFEEQRQ